MQFVIMCTHNIGKVKSYNDPLCDIKTSLVSIFVDEILLTKSDYG